MAQRAPSGIPKESAGTTVLHLSERYRQFSGLPAHESRCGKKLYHPAIRKPQNAILAAVSRAILRFVRYHSLSSAPPARNCRCPSPHVKRPLARGLPARVHHRSSITGPGIAHSWRNTLQGSLHALPLHACRQFLIKTHKYWESANVGTRRAAFVEGESNIQ